MSRQVKILSAVLALFAFCYFCCGPLCASADAVALVDDALIAVIITALAALGITFVGGSYMYGNAEDWVRDMISESGVSFSGNSVAINSASNFLLNNRFVIAVSALADFIKAKYSLVNNSQYTIVESYSLMLEDGTPVRVMEGDWPRNTSWPPADTTFIGTMFQLGVRYTFNNGVEMYTDYISGSGFELVYIVQGISVATSTIPLGGTSYGLALNLRDQDALRPVAISGTQTMSMDGMSYNSNILNLLPVTSTIDLAVKTGVIDIPSASTIGDSAGILVGPFPWGESLRGAINDVPGLVESDGLAGNTTLTLDSADVVEEEIDTEATNDIPVSSDATDYEVSGLSSVFPFCIPFDLYNFVECLAADPVAPTLNWRFYVPGIVDQTIVLDLSVYDSAAQILRTMELLLFCVGLAFVTRKIIRG